MMPETGKRTPGSFSWPTRAALFVLLAMVGLAFLLSWILRELASLYTGKDHNAC